MTDFTIDEKVFNDMMVDLNDMLGGLEEIMQNEANKTVKNIEQNVNDNQRICLHGKVCEFIHNTYVEKNSDYGNSFSKVRKKYPEAICVRLNDKLSRLEQLLKPNYERKVKDEAIEDTLIDLACYAIMELVEMMIEGKQDGENN